MSMSEIKLARVDFRLMHGQVVTTWIQQVSADAILIVDDKLASDKFLAQVFLMAAPPGVQISIKSIKKAVLGAEKQISTPQGNVMLKISPFTKNGQKIRLSNCGLNENEKIGDMIITVEIQINKNLNDEEINLYKKLRELASSKIR